MPTLTAEAATELFRRPPDALVEVDGGAVAHRVVGNGPDVLLVHGWPVSGATFHRLLPHLAPHVTCHVLDLVGAGSSRFDPSTPIDLALHVRSVRSVVDRLGLDDVAVVGHDSGGLVARHAFADDPRVRAFGLVDTEQTGGLTRRFRQFLLMGRLPGFASVLAWAAMRPRLRRSPFLLGDCFTDRDLLGGTFEELHLAPLRDDPERRWAAGAFARSFDTGLVAELEAVHARIDVPVQLVWGEHDPFFPVDRARAMVATFPDAHLEVVPDGRLFVHEEFPQQVATALLPTLLGPHRR